LPSLKPTAAESLASAARALHYALDELGTVDAAFKKLYAAADPQQHETLRSLESLLRSPESEPAAPQKLRLSSFPTLAWLLRQTSAPERSAAALFGEFRRHQSFSATAMFTVWSEFSGFLAYLGAVLAVLVVLVIMYGLFVLPQFRSLYGQFGAALPRLTSLMFGGGAPLFTLLLLSAIALLAFLSWFVFDLRGKLRRYAPLPAGYHKLPLVGTVALAYNQYLWLSYAALLRATGMSAVEALRIAGSRLPLAAVERWEALPIAGEPGLVNDLALAFRLGKLDEEALYQQEATVDSFLAALHRCRSRSRLLLTICVYYLVASYVAAMYLPIFSLGSAI
jgi:hypothetical protein